MRNGFDDLADDYAVYRPVYPDALVDLLVERCGLAPGARVLDLGAGTGKAAAPFASRGYRVVSVDQSVAMMRHGMAAGARPRFVCGTAESLPVIASAFRLVLAGQSFHLFDPDNALAECARVLTRDGCLAVCWYSLNVDLPHTRDIARVLASFGVTHESLNQAVGDWKARIEAGGHFVVEEQRRLAFEVPMRPADWIGLARTIPVLRAGGAAVERAIAECLAPYGAVACPYIADLWLARRPIPGATRAPALPAAQDATV